MGVVQDAAAIVIEGAGHHPDPWIPVPEVWRGNDQSTVFAQTLRQLTDQVLWMLHVLDHICSYDDVETGANVW